MTPSKKSETMEPIAIIGIGCQFPDAQNPGRYWANIKEGVDSIREVPDTHWSIGDYYDEDAKKRDHTYGRRGGFLSPFQFDPMKYGIPPNVIEATDTSQLLALAVSEAAMADAGYGLEHKFDRERVSVILGVTGALELAITLGARLGHPKWRRAMEEAGIDAVQVADAMERMSDSYVEWQENSFPGLLGNVVAGRVSKYLDLGGTNCVVDAACASSLSAVHLAILELAAGKADMALAGGVDTFNDIFMYMCFSKTPALSPTGNARPFDHLGDGTMLGEGLGMVVLKRLEDAECDGDRIYAVMKGIGSSSDGKGDAIYAPNSEGQMKALRKAYENAGVATETIELVEAHGTGTVKGDAVEAVALDAVYGNGEEPKPWCALGSVKSQIGHTKAAAGAAGIIKAALALYEKVLPPTIKVDLPQEAVAPNTTPFYINTVKRPWLPNERHPRRAGVSSFGFGGTNFHCVLEEYAAKKAAPDWDGDVQILAFSADTPAVIEQALESVSNDLSWESLRALGKSSRADFKHDAGHRMVLLVQRDKTKISKLVQMAKELLHGASDDSFTSKECAFYGHGKADGKLGVVFPGQGAQYPGMQRDLACQFPEMLEVLAEADRVFSNENDGERLWDRIYPHPAFDKETKTAHEKALRETDVAQPAIGAVSLGAIRLLEEFGVQAETFAGHSYGELTALCAAGRFDETSLFRISQLRGRLMAAGEGDKGSMFAVRAPLDDVEAVLQSEGLDLILANRNAPEQAVLSGSTDEIDRAAGVFKAKKMSGTKLQVSAAFHSPLVADAAAPLLEGLHEIKWHKGKVPVYSNTTGRAYPDTTKKAQALLAEQLARPVDFVKEIESLYASGVRTFVEVGPGARLTGLIGKILNDNPHRAFALDGSNGKGDGIVDLGMTLGRLAAEGRDVDLAKWDAAFEPEEAPPAARMTVPITGANYRSARKPRAPRQAARSVKPETRAPQQPATLKSTLPSVPLSPSPQAIAKPQPATGPPRPVDSTVVGLVRQAQENINAIQRMQEQTTALHKQYLEGQESASNSFRQLMEQQQRMLDAALTGTTPPAPSPVERVSTSPSLPDVHVTNPAVEIPSLASESASSEPSSHSSEGSGEVQRALLEIVSEKTGYPVEMLELQMSLDGDLGIDSIKRVEILSALQDHMPHLPSIAAEDMGSLVTLGDVVAQLESFATDQPAVSSDVVAKDALQTALLEVVSEKTGYPVDMLEVEMSLDGDLGIDSIKRVEILSTLQEKMPGLPTVAAEDMGQLQTLGDVISYLVGVDPVAQPESADTAVQDLLLTVVSDKTGYPVDMLELEMNLDGDLGIDSIKRVEILSAMQEAMPGLPSVEAEDLGALQTLGDVVAYLNGNAPGEGIEPAPRKNKPVLPVANDTTAPSSLTIERRVLESQPLPDTGGVSKISLRGSAEVWVSDDGSEFSQAIKSRLEAMELKPRLVPLDDPTSWEQLDALEGLILCAPESGIDDAYIKNTFCLTQHCARALRATGKTDTAVFATITRIDGEFGLAHAHDHTSASAGALAGLVKTAAHEWPEVSCRALDVAGDFASVEKGALSVVQAICAEGPVELGLSKDRTTALLLREETLSRPAKCERLEANDVVVISGGARGVTADVAVALAEEYACKLVLLGRSPEPRDEEDWLSDLKSEAAIKKGLFEHGRQSPAEVEQRYRSIVSNRAIVETLERIKSSGGQAHYYSVDVRDTAEMARMLGKVQRRHGAITALIHGAGVLADRRIEDQTQEQFDFVYDTKVKGLRNLLAPLADAPLKALVCFSSSTARYGRSGQAAYAMANETLNKMAQVEARRRPECKVLSMNWGPWDGGMITPSLRPLFEKEGVGLIECRAGAGALLAELEVPCDGPVEIVITGPTTTMTDTLETSQLSTVLEFEVATETHPYLSSHVIDEKGVLPVAMYVEWFAHGAIHGNPGLRFHGVEDLRVLRGVLIDEEQPLAIKILAGKASKDGALYRVPVELRSLRDGEHETVHSRADILLCDKLPSATSEMKPLTLKPYTKLREEFYDGGVLFHGKALQGIQEVGGCSAEGIVATAKTASRPGEWMASPLRKSWLADPLILDSAFQMLILWSHQQHGACSLPTHIGSYRQFQSSFPKGRIEISARIIEQTPHKAIAHIEFKNPVNNQLIARMEGYECVIDETLNEAFRRNRFVHTREEG